VKVSRGPGILQRRILEVLGHAPAQHMEWDRLRRRFPDEVRQKTFYRALRGLMRMGRVELIVEYGGYRYLRRVPPTLGDLVKDDEELKQLFALFDLLSSMGEPSSIETETLEKPAKTYGESAAGEVTYRLSAKSQA
jgi:hypothetical protein